ALDGKVDENAAITGATKTKITYDAKGLVTVGADATTADIADSTNKRYVTDAQATVIGNTSGTNTGDNATNSQYSGLAASKQDALTLTTTGTSGAATLVGATLNIPQYSGGGGTTWGSITGTLSTQTDLQTALDLKVPYTGATGDVDLGNFSLNAKSIHAKGTAGNGHLGLKHQSSGSTAAGSESVIYADSVGDPKWKNASNTVQSVMLQNTAITGATKTKITYDAKGLVTAGADATTADIAASTNKNYVTDAQATVIGNTSGTNSGNQTLANTSDATSHTVTLSSTGGSVQLVEGSGITLTTTGTTADGIITIASTGGGGGSGTVTNVSALTLGTTGTDLSSTVANSTTTPVITLNVPTASATNRGALSSANWSTFNGKQDALVSGTNIKTINSTSILGSGNLVVAAAPSGVSGSVQFSDGTSLSSDAANFFYDNTNDRLGLGINAPTSRLHVKGSGATSATTSLKIVNSASTELLNITDDGTATFGNRIDVNQPNISINSIATAITNGSFIGANLTGTKIGLLVGTNQSGYSYLQGRYGSGVEHIRIQEYGSGISVGSATGDGYIGIGRNSQLASSRLGISVAPTASANYGLVSLGSGAFDGATAGFFTGAAAGTAIAVNLASGGTSDFLNFQVAGVGKFKVSSAGKPSYETTNTPSGTTGNQTINKPSGTVNIAAAGTTITVTNSLVSTSSIVIAVVRTNDTTAYIKNVVSGTGSFDINLGAAATAEVSIGFIVNN
ncbi:MAG: beta strand repeat-containing protein, partial [Bacteroidales bacterium]